MLRLNISYNVGSPVLFREIPAAFITDWAFPIELLKYVSSAMECNHTYQVFLYIVTKI